MQTKILLTSCSPLKVEGIKKYFKEFKGLKNDDIKIDTFNVNSHELVAQPINGSIEMCAKQRLKFTLNSSNDVKCYDFIISIENGLYTKSRSDVCYAVIIKGNCDQLSDGKGDLIGIGKYEIPASTMDKTNLINAAFDQLEKESIVKCESEYGTIEGYKTTLGKIINWRNHKISHNNWMLTLVNFDRVDQISYAIANAMQDLNKKCQFKDKFL
jgi:hypothetical protein